MANLAGNTVSCNQRWLPMLIKLRSRHLQILYRWSVNRFASLAQMDLISINDRRWLNFRAAGLIVLYPLLNAFILLYLFGSTSSRGDLWSRFVKNLAWMCAGGARRQSQRLYAVKRWNLHETVVLFMPTSHRLFNATPSHGKGSTHLRFGPGLS